MPAARAEITVDFDTGTPLQAVLLWITGYNGHESENVYTPSWEKMV